MRTLDYTTKQPKTQFKVGEKVYFEILTEDPDCAIYNSCNNTKGVIECKWKDNTGSASWITPDTNGDASTYKSYGSTGNYNTNTECYDAQNNKGTSNTLNYEIISK